jgi:hypothetical protein
VFGSNLTHFLPNADLSAEKEKRGRRWQDSEEKRKQIHRDVATEEILNACLLFKYLLLRPILNKWKFDL